MIGALSSIESHFGFLWEVEKGESVTPEKDNVRNLSKG